MKGMPYYINRLDTEQRQATGVIRTLPYFGAGDTQEAQAKRAAYRRMMEAFTRIENGADECVRIAFSQRPTLTVLHYYILVEGKIRVRANIASWEAGTGEQVDSWDGHDLSDAKWWAILTSPVSYPPEPITRKGFQGFRYTETLW